MIYGEGAVNLVTTTTATLPIYALTTHFSLSTTMRLQMITPCPKNRGWEELQDDPTNQKPLPLLFMK